MPPNTNPICVGSNSSSNPGEALSDPVTSPSATLTAGFVSLELLRALLVQIEWLEARLQCQRDGDEYMERRAREVQGQAQAPIDDGQVREEGEGAVEGEEQHQPTAPSPLRRSERLQQRRQRVEGQSGPKG